MTVISVPVISLTSTELAAVQAVLASTLQQLGELLKDSPELYTALVDAERKLGRLAHSRTIVSV